jgi:hypothetical protein
MFVYFLCYFFLHLLFFWEIWMSIIEPYSFDIFFPFFLEVMLFNYCFSDLYVLLYLWLKGSLYFLFFYFIFMILLGKQFAFLWHTIYRFSFWLFFNYAYSFPARLVLGKGFFYMSMIYWFTLRHSVPCLLVLPFFPSICFFFLFTLFCFHLFLCSIEIQLLIVLLVLDVPCNLYANAISYMPYIETYC